MERSLSSLRILATFPPSRCTKAPPGRDGSQSLQTRDKNVAQTRGRKCLRYVKDETALELPGRERTE
jgi:hypothetical protein